MGRSDHGHAAFGAVDAGGIWVHSSGAATRTIGELMTVESSSLEHEIRRRIELAGPMPVGQYMSLCLTHPEHGYYATRDPLGRSGDFITAPEVSQIFGELLGLWAVTVWRALGEPVNINFVELGPGRG